MADQRNTSLKFPSDESKLPSNNNDEVMKLYKKMILSFPQQPTSKAIRKWMEYIISDLMVNPKNTQIVCKYFLLFSYLKCNVQSLGIEMRRCLLQVLESLYNVHVEGESELIKYRNFTYFFGSAINIMWNPISMPLSRDLMSALLILISKFDIMEDFDNALVYSKCVYWLSRYMVHGTVSNVIFKAYEEALNRLRELISSGKGSLVSVAALEATVNHGKLNETAVSFYSKSLAQMDFLDLNDDFTILVPKNDQDKYTKSNLNIVLL